MTVVTAAPCDLGLGLERSQIFISSYSMKVCVTGAKYLLCAFIVACLQYMDVIHKPADFPIIVFILSLFIVSTESKLALLFSVCLPSIRALPEKKKRFSVAYIYFTGIFHYKYV